MTKDDYVKIQNFLVKKLKEAPRRYSSRNKQEGFEDAILVVRSFLHSEYNNPELKDSQEDNK